MDNIILIKRRLNSSLRNDLPILSGGEIAFNEKTYEFLYGAEIGTISIGGSGAFVSLQGTQTIIGNKTFAGNTTLAGNVTLANTYFSSSSIVNLAGNRVQNLGTPVVLTDAVNKSYVDELILNKLSISGGTLTGGLSAPALSGVHFGDGSRLFGVSSSDKLPLSGGTLTGGLLGTRATFSTSISAPALSGVHFGDGSRLTGIVGGTANALPLSGGTLTGNLYGTRGIFNTSVTAPAMSSVFYGTFIGNGAFLTNIAGTSGNSGGADPTKLSLLGGTLLGDLYGTNATFNTSISAPIVSGTFYGDGSNLTGLPSTYTPPADVTFTSSVSAPTLSGTFYGDGSNLTGIVSPVGIYVPLSGGVVEGNLTITGTLSTADTDKWQSTFTIVGANSAQWSAASDPLSSYSFFGDDSATYFDLSASVPHTNAAGYLVSMNGATQVPFKDYVVVYDSGTNKLNTLFVPPLGSEISVVYLGNRINSITTTTIIYEGGGGGGSDVSMISGNWQNTYTSVRSNSSNWQNTYTNVQTNSALWNITTDSTKLSLSGGTIYGNLLVTGSLSVLSGATIINTVFNNTSALQITNEGLGPALYVSQGPGPGDIASFYDGDGIEVLHIGNALNPIAAGVIGINTSYPNKTLTVVGEISATSDISTTGLYYGNGSNLTSLNANNISQGTLNNERLPSVITVTSSISAPAVSGTFYGDGTNLTGVVHTQYSPPADATFTSSVSAPSLSGVHYGDGSNLTGLPATYTPPADATFTSSVSAPALSGTFYGDGSNLTGVIHEQYTPPADATFTSSVSAPALSGVHYGDGTNLTGVVHTQYSPPADATFTSSVSAPALSGTFYGDGSLLTGVIHTQYVPPADATFTSSVSAPALNGVHYGDGSNLIGVKDVAKLPLSGGQITGNLTVTGNISASGITYFTNTVFSNTSAIRISNNGQGPALYVQQGIGSGDIASFYDADGIEALHVGNAKNTIGQDPNGVIGIKTSYPNKTLTVVGEISATGEVWASKYYGDGSSLTSVIGTDSSKLPLSGGTLTGNLTGTSATFTSVSATKFLGDGSSLTGLSVDTTKLVPLSGGTMTGNLKVAAGTSTSVPILFQAGAITTSLTAHAMEWDGTQLYNTTSSFIRRKVSYADEAVTIFSANPANSATNIFYTDTQEIHFYTLPATNNFVVDVSGNSTTPYNNVATTNSSRTICVINTSGPTAYVPTLKIDGATQTVKWQGSQSTGNANALDVWTFTIIKTEASTYTILGSVTMYM